jgi:hypothetical protein
MTELPLILEKYMADTDSKQHSVEQAQGMLTHLIDMSNAVSGSID